MQYKLELIEDINRFKSLEVAWGKLLQKSEKLGFFNSWVWSYTWWTIYAEEDDSLFILTAWNADELLGLAPFFIKNTCWGLSKELHFIGTGEPEDIEVATEYLDLIVAPSDADKFCDVLADKLFSINRLNSLEFKNLLDSSICLNSLVPLINKKYFNKEYLCGYRYLRLNKQELKNSPDDGLNKLNRKYKVAMSRFERRGEANVYFIKYKSDLDWAMTTLVQLHEQRWQEKGKRGVFHSSKFLAFHAKILNYLFDTHNLILMILSSGDQSVAAFYGWKYGNTLSYYQSGIDTKYRPNMSPGLVMHMEAINWAIQHKLDYYDLMKGGETSYKSDYAEKKQAMYNLLLYKKSFFSLLLQAIRVLSNRISGFLK